MKNSSLELLICPSCHGNLDLKAESGGSIDHGSLKCTACRQEYPIERGIPQFINSAMLSGFNLSFSRMYDWFSWIYRAFSRLAFAFIGMQEETGRREITDRLDPKGDPVLEVSIGPGVNLPSIIDRPDMGDVIGLDISLGQLLRCQGYLRRKGWDVDLFLGNGEKLPFQDNSFGGVFHVGGINFFNDKKAAIDEMIRVAKPGARILIADETEKGARGYERFIPGFKGSFGDRRPEIIPPLDLLPAEMQETRLFDVWKGWLYCIEFRKP